METGIENEMALFIRALPQYPSVFAVHNIVKEYERTGNWWNEPNGQVEENP